MTPGEPAGIGPDLLLAEALRAQPAELVAVADPLLLARRAQRLGLDLRLPLLERGQPPSAHRRGRLWVHPVPLARRERPGRPDPANARAVLDSIAVAVALTQRHRGTALVTGPVHKAAINEAGVAFRGHTEFLARLTGARCPVMLLCGAGLRVALATTHLPLRDVPATITGARLRAVLDVLHGDLRRRFGIARPRIRVAGLNPHAGEQGHLGDEDRRVIAPAIRAARQRRIRASGPWPADTLFTAPQLAEADAVLAMYHDQGLPVLKHAAFGTAVNVTLGLPIIRTSVDHGTALDRAATGDADAGSFRAAIRQAAELVRRG